MLLRNKNVQRFCPEDFPVLTKALTLETPSRNVQ